MFPSLNLPEFELKKKQTEKGDFVFDIIRKKYVLFTPEEYVRQYFIRYLIDVKHYPKGLTSVEKQLEFYNLKKRTDIVMYDKKGKVEIIVECKAPGIQISQLTFDQIARYNMNFKAKYLIVTNGLQHYCCQPDYTTGTYTFLKEIPVYRSE